MSQPATLPSLTVGGRDLIDIIAEAVEARLKLEYGEQASRVYFKATNITVDAGTVQRKHMAIELRRRTG